MKPAPTTLVSRTIFNPVAKDTVTFVKTSSETDGQYTLLEVTLAAGGGVPLHYHDTIDETFTCLDGTLSIQLGKQIIQLQPGESATAPANSLHRFFNQSTATCHFQCRVAPGSSGFEQSLQIGYGLARDGKVTKTGIPRDLSTLGYIFLLNQSRIPGILSFLQPLLLWLGRRAETNGLAAELQRKYVTIH